MINHNEKNIKKKNVYICKLNHFAEQQKLIPHCKSTNTSIKKKEKGISLVVQWLRIHLPMQGTWVQALLQENTTCRGVAKPVRHNYWAHVPQLLKPACLEPVLCNKRSHCNEKAVYHNEEYPLLAATRESPRAAMKTQCSQKQTNK